ncbi:MAG: carboxypeptidase regulatory-like domain-containing protein, partial [Opitutae bacterium]|nr:carboxypeptidase regulatory-like domain-containing protein [Opitutae bacterium]
MPTAFPDRGADMNRSPRLRVISFGLLFLLVRSAWAAPPNDSFSNPTIVSGFPATATGSNVDASLQVNESLPDAWDGDGEASVWFGWTAPASGSVRIDTFGSDFDTMLAVWTGTAVDALILLAENDQYDGDQSAVFVSVTAGTTYRIGVYGWLNAQGVIALHITNDILSKISGTVTGPTGTPPLEGISVEARQWNGSRWRLISHANTGASGNYAIGGLTAGTYRVEFQDYSGNYLPEVYSNAPTLDAGMDIVVAAGTTVSNVNAALATASKIAGTV